MDFFATLVIGGNGSTRATVAKSCETAFTYWNVTNGKLYVDEQLKVDDASASREVCVNGTSLASEGLKPTNPALSCAAIQGNFSSPSGIYYTHSAGGLAFCNMSVTPGV